MERKPTGSGRSDPRRPAQDKGRAASESPPRRGELAELVLAGRGPPAEGGIGPALGDIRWGVGPRHGPGGVPRAAP